jgi:hypothetical protein
MAKAAASPAAAHVSHCSLHSSASKYLLLCMVKHWRRAPDTRSPVLCTNLFPQVVALTAPADGAAPVAAASATSGRLTRPALKLAVKHPA